MLVRGILNAMQRTLIVFVFLAIFSFASQTASAQFGSAGTELSMTMLPEHPKPGEAIVVYLESYNIDLNRSEVRWFVNNKPVQSGVGKKQLETSAGKSGELLTIRVSVRAENGSLYSSGLEFRPAEVNLLWQTESYTPPFYKGKALMPYQGTVLVAALPAFIRGGTSLPADALIYTWKEGDDVIGDSSGKGKNLFVFQGSVPLRTKTISVLVESPDRSMSAEASVDVVPVSPRLLLYEDHPRFGLLFGKALVRRFSLTSDETRISAIPYYFEAADRAGREITYGWQLNYNELPSEKGPALTLRRVTYSKGQSNLFLEARSADTGKTFQAAEERLVIDFPAKTPFEEQIAP